MPLPNLKIVRAANGTEFRYFRNTDGGLVRLPSSDIDGSEFKEAYTRAAELDGAIHGGFKPLAHAGLFIGTEQGNRGRYYYLRDGKMTPLLSKVNTPGMFSEIAGHGVAPEDFQVDATVKRVLAHCLSRSRARDKGRGRHCKISLDDLVSIYAKQGGLCAMTGMKFVIPDKMHGDDRRSPWLPSIDRIDNAIGYTLDNVQLVTVMANLAKAEFSEAAFHTMCAQTAMNKGLVKIASP